jgi:hypothetical protein
MTNTSELLLKLQGLDYQLGELERSKDYLPDMIENLDGEIEAAKASLAEMHDQLEATKLEHRRLELRVKDKAVELERLKSQMTNIKTNKEYDALSREIDNNKNDVTESEDGIIGALDAIEQLTKDIEARTLEVEDIKKTNSEQLASIKVEIDSVGDKIKIKNGERQNVLVRLDAPLIAVYERVRRGKGAGTVVGVRHGACSGCFKTHPPQLIQEIRKGERVITCDSCGRILIWDGDSPEA